MAEKKNLSKNTKNQTPFDELEELFFSEGKSTSKIVKKYDLEEDSEEEDFGYAGDIDDHMALDTGDETDFFERSLAPSESEKRALNIENFQQNAELKGEANISIEEEALLQQSFNDGGFDEFEVSSEDDTDMFEKGSVSQDVSEEEIQEIEPSSSNSFSKDEALGESLEVFPDENSNLFPKGQTEEADETDFFELSEGNDSFWDSVGQNELIGAGNIADEEVVFVTEEVTPTLHLDQVSTGDEYSDDLSEFLDDTEDIDAGFSALEQKFVPLSDEEFYRKRRLLLEGEARLHPVTNSIWVECARYSWHNLREDDKALQFYEKAREHGGLRNEEIRAYSNIVARTKKVGRFVELLQEWALGREGVLAAEAWNDIAIFFRKNLNRLDLALKASERAVEADSENWLSHQLICQLHEQQEDWGNLVASLENMKQLAVGSLRSQIAWQQGMVSLGKLSEKEQAVGYFKEAIQLEPDNLQMMLIVKKLGQSMQDEDLCAEMLNKIAAQFEGKDKLLWTLQRDFLTKEGKEGLLQVLDELQDPELFWFRFALMQDGAPDGGQLELQIKTLEDWLEKQPESEELARVWFRLSELRKKAGDPSYFDAVLKTIELDPSAIIVVDEYVNYLLKEKRYQDCVDWLRELSKRAADKESGISMAYLTQAAFISDVYLGDISLASEMLADATFDNSNLSYLAEITYLRGGDWGRLIEFYKDRARQATLDEEASHWLIQAARVAETDLEQPEQAEELYSLAMERSKVSYVGMTDILRLKVRFGDWKKVVALIHEHAENAINPAASFYIAANLSHCLLKDDAVTRKNVEACLALDPDHVAALLLLRSLETDASKRIVLSRRLKEKLQDPSMIRWLDIEISSVQEVQGEVSRLAESEGYLELDKLYAYLRSGQSAEHLVDSFGSNAYVDLLLMASGSLQKDSDKLSSIVAADDVGIGTGLWLEDIGRADLAISVYERLDSRSANLQLARVLEHRKQYEKAMVVLEKLFESDVSDLQVLLKLEKLLRIGSSQHTRLAEVVGSLAEELETPPTANYYALLSGQLFEHLGETKKAERFYLQAFQYRPCLGKVFSGLRSIYIQTHEIDTMEKLFKQINQPVLLEYSETMEEFRAFDRAVAGYEKLLELSTDVPAYDLIPYYSRIERCYEKLGAWDKVLETIELSLQHVQSLSYQEHLDAKRRWLLLEHLSETDLALETYQKMLEEDPHDRDVLQSLSKIAIQHGKTEQAIEYLERLSLDPLNAIEASTIQRTLAEAYGAQGDIEKEKASLQAALDLDGTNPETFAMLGRLYRRAEQWQELVNLLAREYQVRDDSERLGCRREIAQIAEDKLQNYELALEELLKVYELVGEDRDVLRSLVSLSKKVDDLEGAVRYSKELLGMLSAEDGAALCLDIADIYANELLEEAKAVQYWEQALSGKGSFQAASEHLEANYLLLGQWQKLYDLLMQKQEYSKDEEERVNLLLRIAEIAETSLLNDDLAGEAYDIILEIEPQNMSALQRRSQRLYQSKSWSDLVSLYADSEQRFLATGSSFEQKQEQLQFYYQFAEALIALDEVDAAIQKLDRALQINPSHISSLRLLAEVCLSVNDWEAAYEKYQRLLILVDGNSNQSILWEIYLNLGFCALRMNDVDHAIAFYQKARLRNASSLLTLKGLTECHFVKQEYSRAAQLCSNIVEQAVEVDDVVFGYGFRGFLLETQFKKAKLAKQHYFRALEYDVERPVLILRLVSLLLREGGWAEVQELLSRGGALVDDGSELAEYYDLAFSVMESENIVGADYERLQEFLSVWDFF